MGRDVRHAAPVSDQDFDFFFNGLEAGKLMIQRCRSCGSLRNPPSPACGACQSFAFDEVALSGDGVIYSYTIHYHPPLADFPVPHPIVVADMAEGVRVLGGLAGAMLEEIRIGDPVTIEFFRHEGMASYRFRHGADQPLAEK